MATKYLLIDNSRIPAIVVVQTDDEDEILSTANRYAANTACPVDRLEIVERCTHVSDRRETDGNREPS